MARMYGPIRRSLREDMPSLPGIAHRNTAPPSSIPPISYPGMGATPGPGGLAPTGVSSLPPFGATPGPGGLVPPGTIPGGPPAGGGNPGKPYPGYMTAAQIRAQAMADWQTVWGPQQAAYDAQLKRNQDYAKFRAGLIQGLYSQLAELEKTVSPQIQELFQTAAGDQAALSKGYSTGMQAAQQGNADAANSVLSRIDAPSGQNLTVNPAGSDVLYGLTGALPAGTWDKQGAAWASAAAYLPVSTMYSGDMAVKSWLDSSKAERDAITSELMKAQASGSQFIQSEVTSLGQSQAQLQSDYLNRRAADRKLSYQQWKDRQDLGIRRAKIKADLIAKGWSIDAANRRTKAIIDAENSRNRDSINAENARFSANLDWQRQKYIYAARAAGQKPRPGEGVVDSFASKSKGWLVDKYGNYVLVNGKRQQVTQTAATPKTARVLKTVRTATGVVTFFYDPTTKRTYAVATNAKGSGLPPQQTKKQGGQTPVQAQTAVRRTTQAVSQESRTYARGGRTWKQAYDGLYAAHVNDGIDPGTLDKIIRRTLRSQGYNTAGQSGRNVRSAYQKRPKKTTAGSGPANSYTKPAHK